MKIINYQLSNTPSLKDARIIENDLTPEAIEKIYMNTDKWFSKPIGVTLVGNNWFKLGLTVNGNTQLYCPITDEAVTLIHNLGGRQGILVQDFITNNPR